jgi:subtilase-type serine protease
LMEGLPYLRPSLEAGWIAAVNGVPTFSNGNVSSVQLLSSACYESARWCMVADGAWQVPDPALQLDPGNSLVTGSSFAAPQISGALALLQDAFPTLTPHQLRVRLLASADDDFFAKDAYVELATGYNKGYSFTYGHGFLDIEASLKPIGPTAMSLANGGAVATDAPVLMTGSAFGDAVAMSLATTDVMVKDALSAGFVMPAGALTAPIRPGSQASALLSRSLTRNLEADRVEIVSALANPFGSTQGNTVRMTGSDGQSVASVLIPQGSGDSVGVNVTRVLSEGPLRVEMGLKIARDDGQKMSLDGTSGAMMASVSLGLTQDLGANAFLALSGEVGMSDLGGATALSESTSARFDSAALTIGRSDVFAEGDRVTLSVSMPVAIASGRTVLDLPVYRQGAAMSYEAVALNLAPESRQMDFEIGYQAGLADGLEMKLSLAHSENFGNQAGQVDTGGAIAFTFRF